jgi:hypothetical protein
MKFMKLTRIIKKKNLPYGAYLSNIHSQNGEDGVLNIIINRLGAIIPENGSCVEFGAWDGKLNSNTFALVEKGWSAVYIEKDKIKFNNLVQNSKKYPKIIPICAEVDHKKFSTNSLDNILKKTPLQKNFDILSIDIDSYDLEVWESMQNYEPKIVIIEINSAYRVGLKRRHSDHGNRNSFTSTLEVAAEKNYKLVCHTGNLIFVQEDLVSKLKIQKLYLDYPELLYSSKWRNQLYRDRIITLMPILRLIKKFTKSFISFNLKH